MCADLTMLTHSEFQVRYFIRHKGKRETLTARGLWIFASSVILFLFSRPLQNVISVMGFSFTIAQDTQFCSILLLGISLCL